MTTPAPMTDLRPRPTGWLYLLPILSGVVGVVLAIAFLVSGFRDTAHIVDNMTGTEVGDTTTLTILKPGGYTLAIVGPSFIQSDQDKERFLNELNPSTVSESDGQPVPLLKYDGLRKISVDQDTEYVPLATFHFDKPGDFAFATSLSSRVDPSLSQVIVSPSPFEAVRKGLKRALVAIGLGLGLGLLSTVILARLRGRSKRKIASAQAELQHQQYAQYQQSQQYPPYPPHQTNWGMYQGPPR